MSIAPSPFLFSPVAFSTTGFSTTGCAASDFFFLAPATLKASDDARPFFLDPVSAEPFCPPMRLRSATRPERMAAQISLC